MVTFSVNCDKLPLIISKGGSTDSDSLRNGWAWAACSGYIYNVLNQQIALGLLYGDKALVLE